jgi:hypothetical protein
MREVLSEAKHIMDHFALIMAIAVRFCFGEGLDPFGVLNNYVIGATPIVYTQTAYFILNKKSKYRSARNTKQLKYSLRWPPASHRICQQKEIALAPRCIHHE